jgi:hypothetical protein
MRSMIRAAYTGTGAHPVFLGDRLLIRDQLVLRSFRIEQDAGE